MVEQKRERVVPEIISSGPARDEAVSTQSLRSDLNDYNIRALRVIGKLRHRHQERERRHIGELREMGEKGMIVIWPHH